jgi:quercetin dioxygenase-like cupin family protein
MKRILLALAACAVATTWAAETHTMIAPGQLEWGNVPSMPPGASISVIEGPMSAAAPFVVRLKFPADYRIPAHTHPGIEHVTVLSGTFYMGTGDTVDAGSAMALSPGSVAIMQPGTRHYALTRGEEVIVQVHGTGPWGITYVNPADDPRKK